MFKDLVRFALILAGLGAASLAMNEARAAEYTLMPTPQTVHIGNFNAATKPALTINSGDTVIIETAAADGARPRSSSRASSRRAPCRNTCATSIAR